MTNKIPKKKDRPGVDKYGRTELLHAAIEGDLEKLPSLIQAHSDVNHQDDDGWTALHFAAQNRHLKIVDLLLKSGANPNLTNSHGNSPLFPAVMNARGNFDIICLLLSAGANPTHKNNHGKSPYDVALMIQNGLEKVFETVKE